MSAEWRWYTAAEWHRLNEPRRRREAIKARVDRMSPTEYLAHLADEEAQRRDKEAREARECAEALARRALDKTPMRSHVEPLRMVLVGVGDSFVLTRALRAGQSTLDVVLPDDRSVRAIRALANKGGRIGGERVIRVEWGRAAHNDYAKARIHLEDGMLPAALW